MSERMEISTLEIDGRPVRAAVARGSSPTPLLIFNGIGANLELVAPFAEAMQAAGVTTIVFDAPGVGGSPTPTLPYRFSRLARRAAQLVERLGFAGPIDVLGVSWGGAAAQQFARQYPQRCRRLILAATSAGAVMLPGKLSALTLLLNPRRYSDPDFMTRVGGKLYGGRLRYDTAQLREHARHMARPHGRGYVYQLLATAGWTSVLWLRTLRQPTLIMMGTDDPIVPLLNGKLLASLIPRARLLTFDDGHLFLLTRAEEIAPIVRDFLAEGL